jgi:cytochrome c553
MHPLYRHALGVIGLCLTLPGVAADRARGEDLAFTHHCMTCHGQTGKSNASRYPNLAGQQAAYLEARLAYFRARTEPGNQMNAQAVHLSSDEIADLAAYFSAQPR